MQSLFNIIGRIAALVSFFAFLSMIAFIITAVKYKHRRMENYILCAAKETCPQSQLYIEYPLRFTLFTIIMLAGLLYTDATFNELIGNNNLETKPAGSYCYYVNAENGKSGKQYTLPAKIDKSYYEYEEIDGDIHSVDTYYVEKVYFSNGGYLHFEYDEPSEDFRFSNITDQEGRGWNLTIINEHAYTNQFIETTSITKFDVIVLVLLSSALLFSWATCIVLSRQKEVAIIKTNTIKRTATEILEQDYKNQMDLIEVFRADGRTDEEILEFMQAS